ncbi:MAG: hypothetical protein C3F06_13665 [Candidatus Methanoperedenaceae archaeon]|nr:MAG: hypothetical protein C3F06_13665 [Candidatus Methanoperedenaceae archaeon]
MKFLERFILDCKAKGMTKHSIETYQSNVMEFLTYYPRPHEVTIDHLRYYLNKLRARNLAITTLKGYMSAVSSFYDFLVFENEIHLNPVPAFRKRYLDRTKYNPSSRQLISVIEMQELYYTAPHILKKVIIMILAKTGIRRGELHDLKESDLDFYRKTIHIPEKKKRSNYIAFMDDELESALKEYLVWRNRKAKTEYLLISNKGGRIHKDAPGMILAELGKKLHLHDPNGPLEQKLSPHTFRHWFTSHLFRAGMNSQYIKFLRGDSMRKESWQIYNHIDIELVRVEYLRCIPQISTRQYIPD